MSPQVVNLPEDVEVFITITGREIPKEAISLKPVNGQEKNITSEQQAVIKFLSTTEGINKEGFDFDTLDAFERWDNGEFKLNFEEKLL